MIVVMGKYLAGVKCVRGENKGSHIDTYNIMCYIGTAVRYDVP